MIPTLYVVVTTDMARSGEGSKTIVYGPGSEVDALIFAKELAYDLRAAVEIFKLVQTHHVKPPAMPIVETLQ